LASSRKPLYPNPFYVLLVVVSAAFVVTTFGWLIAPMVQRKAHILAPGARPPGAGSLALAAWFDRWSVTALAIELVLIVASGFLAMASDRWFPKEGQGDGEG
jgi:hypothetical protein